MSEDDLNYERRLNDLLFQRALPLSQVRKFDSEARISASRDALDRVADQFVDPPFQFLRKIA